MAKRRRRAFSFDEIATAVRDAAECNYPRVPTLRLRCLIVSYSLFEVARRLNHDCKLVGGWYVRNPMPPVKLIFGDPASIALKNHKDVKERHCWVEAGGKIWDITRTQFGEFPRVSTEELGSLHYVRDYIDLDAKTAKSLLPEVGREGDVEAAKIIAMADLMLGAK